MIKFRMVIVENNIPGGREFILFQEEGRDGIVVSTRIRHFHGDNNWPRGTDAERVRSAYVEDYAARIVGHYGGLVTANFYGRLAAAVLSICDQTAELLSDHSNLDLIRRLIFAGRGSYWYDPGWPPEETLSE